MRYGILSLLLVLFCGIFAYGEYIERVDGGAVIGDFNVESDKIVVEDWDGKKYTFYRDFIRRIRSQETGKMNTYSTEETVFELVTDASEEAALSLLKDLNLLKKFIDDTFNFERELENKITVRVFSSTRDYETHFENRFGELTKRKKTLAFYDEKYKDVSSVFAGRDTFTVIAPRVALVYLMLLYPKVMNLKPLWLQRGWYKLFENVRSDGESIDMLGLSVTEMEELKSALESKPFSFEYIFDFEITKDTKLSEYQYMSRLSGAFLQYLAENQRRYGKKFPEMLVELEDYAEPIEALTKITKSVPSFEKSIRRWVQKFEGESPWRIYYRAEKYFLRKRFDRCVDVLADGIKKFPNFEDYRKLRVMALLTDGKAQEAMEDIEKLSESPKNKEMCMYFEALAYFNDDEYHRAAKIFRKLIEQDPAFYRCYEQLLEVFWEQEVEIVTPEEAKQYLDIMLENEPFAYTYVLEGKYYLKIGEPDSAIVPLKKARRRDKENSEIDRLLRRAGGR